MLGIQIVEETVSVLPEYGEIPISFEVSSIFEVQVLEVGLWGFSKSERPVDNPRIKDYDNAKTERPMGLESDAELSKSWHRHSADRGGNHLGAKAPV